MLQNLTVEVLRFQVALLLEQKYICSSEEVGYCLLILVHFENI